MAALAAAARLAAAESVQLIRDIQQLAAADPFQPVAARVGGVVTWVDPSAGKFFYIQDSSGGVQVTFDHDRWPQLGEVLTVDGLLVRGDFAPAITGATITKVKRSPLPTPKNASGGGLLNGAYSCERVLVDGWVRSAEMLAPDLFSAVLNSGGARITVRISAAGGMNPEELIATQIAVRGVATPVKARGGTRQLVDVQVLVPRASHFLVQQREARNPWLDPIVPLANAFSYRPGPTRGDRIHVAGQVVHRTGEMIYLNDGTAGLAVRGARLQDIRPGDWLEAVGFMDIELFLPVLSDAVVRLRKEATADAIQPDTREYGELVDGLLHADFVTVTGELIDRMQTPGKSAESTLVFALRTPEGVFPAEVENIGSQSGIPDYEVGCLLEISGVCLVSTDTEGTPTGFRILVPDVKQIRMIRAASFFTVPRLLVMLSITLGVLLLAASYAFVSTRRNMRLISEIGEKRAVNAERSRLARDLHDTLEQGLTGIHLQLHSISPALEEASAETQERLRSVRSLVLQCHTEMRQSIWNLRPATLEQFDLGDALKRIADSLVLDSGIRVELRQQRNNVKIPPLIEDNLLRIGQESLTNAVKHANPAHLKIELETTPGSVSLTISDDGGGSDSLESKPGHFGLVGMRERSTRIGGDLKITRNSAGGYSVRVDVPLPAKQKPIAIS